MELLSIVKDVFEISGRGLVVVPGIPLTCEFVMQLGDALLLKRPDGTEASTRVTGIEMSSGPKPLPFRPLLLGSHLTKADVPVGTEIWIVAPLRPRHVAGGAG